VVFDAAQHGVLRLGVELGERPAGARGRNQGVEGFNALAELAP
jgi:hypothetical protein